jgi:DNA topoisomerase-1
MTQIEALQANGILRVGSPQKGFLYRRARGQKVSASERERIEHLRIPPAWTEVAVNPSASGRLQAVGKDAAGRWQYRYHPAFTERQQQKKYLRLLQFARALPRMRASVDQGLRKRGMSRERVMACILRILSTCFIRPGSQAYADEHGAYGLATLLKRHATVKGDRVVFEYTGKSQKPQHREVHDRRVARVVRALLREAPGRVLFQFQAEDGTWVDVRRAHINQHIKEVMGERFSAKDFRTWAGTLICACALARNGSSPEDSKTLRKRKVVAAVKETAQKLGNTPAVCKSSYIDVTVLQGFDRGQVVSRYFDTVEELAEAKVRGLHRSERALLELLERSGRALGSKRRPVRATSGGHARADGPSQRTGERASPRARSRPRTTAAPRQTRPTGHDGKRPRQSRRQRSGGKTSTRSPRGHRARAQ